MGGVAVSARSDEIRDRLAELDEERRALEAEFSAIVLAEMGVSESDVYEERDTGCCYVVHEARGHASVYSNRNWHVTIRCSRVYKGGRRAGKLARSDTHITLSDRYIKIGTLGPGNKIVALQVS